jgi:hypothetical protein
MDANAIKPLIYAEEFYPFRIHHKKGKIYDVPHRDFAWVSPIGVCIVIEQNGRRHMEILNPALIERISTAESAETEI